MSWTYIDSAKGSGGFAGAADLTLTGCQQGDLLIWLGTDGDGAGNTWEDTGVTDDAGNTYTYCGFAMTEGGVQKVGVWMARHGTGAGTVVMNGPEGAAFTGYIAAAYRHSLGSTAIPVLDGIAAKEVPVGSGTDWFASPPVDSHSTDALVIGIHLNDENSSTLVAGTGYTLRQSQDIFSTNPLILEDRTAGKGSFASTATNGSSTFGLSMTLIFTDASLLPGQNVSQIPIANANDDESGFRTAASWAGVATGAFTADSGIDGIWISMTGVGPYFVDCTVMRFNTGAVLPANAVIQWARIVRRVIGAEGNDGSIAWKADYYDFGGSPMVAGDWKNFSTSDPNIYSEGGERQARNAEGRVPLTNVHTISDLSGIKRAGEVNAQGFTGYTGIREGPDLGALTPTGNNFQKTASFEHATEPPPYLEIGWYVAEFEGDFIFHEPFTDVFFTNSFQGTPQLVATPVHASDPASLEIDTTATEYVFWQDFYDFGDSGMTRQAAGAWVYFDTIPASTTTFMGITFNFEEYVAQILSTGEIRLAHNTGSPSADTGVIVPAATWVWVEFLGDITANPWVIKLRVNMTPAVQVTRPVASSSLSSSSVLRLGPAVTSTLRAYFSLPTWGAPNDALSFLCPQIWPGFNFRTAASSHTSPSTAAEIDMSTAFPTTPSVGDTIFFGIHIKDSVKASVASTGSRATRVTPWVTGETDSYSAPAFSVWQATYDGTSLYEWTFTDTVDRGITITAVAFTGSPSVLQILQSTNPSSTGVRATDQLDPIQVGNTVLGFHGGSAVNDLPFKWRAPFYPLNDEEWYGMNSVAVAVGVPSLMATGKPSGTDGSQSMWTLVELGEPPPAAEKQSGFHSRRRLIGRR